MLMGPPPSGPAKGR
jgi:hypothetical protein